MITEKELKQRGKNEEKKSQKNDILKNNLPCFYKKKEPRSECQYVSDKNKKKRMSACHPLLSPGRLTSETH